MQEHETIVFTDGSSRGNPGPGGFGAIIVAGEKVVELGGREKHTTNNRMELTAAIESLLFVDSNPELNSMPILLYSDSSYVINGITKWIFGWQKSGWITKTKDEVLNRDLWEKLFNLAQGKKIEWKYLGGHVGIAGNERADEIATDFADMKKTNLYDGSLSGYGRDILNFNFNESAQKEKSASKSRSGAKAFSYLSLVDGKLERHKTWAECEARVKGKNAKFKKAISAEDEKNILKEWGI